MRLHPAILDEAQLMMDQVLGNHPQSAKAHYVQAELYAKEGKAALARSELKKAEEFNPGLTFFTPNSIGELKAELGLSDPSATAARAMPKLPARNQTETKLPESRIPPRYFGWNIDRSRCHQQCH